MAIRKVILTERELTRLIKRIVEETQDEMNPEVGEGWLGDKFSDIKKGGRKFFTGYESGEEAESKKNSLMDELRAIEEEIEMDIENDETLKPNEVREHKRELKRYIRQAKEDAKDDNYRGKLVQRGDAVIYVAKPSGMQDMASAAGGEAKIRK